MQRMPRQEYTAKFKELTVKRVKGGMTEEAGFSRAVVTQLGLSCRSGESIGCGQQIVTPEQMELSRLRAENVR
jgi:transposase